MSKYGNKKYIAFDRQFDSKREGLRYCELKTLVMGGEISKLECQKPFELTPTRYYGKECVRWCKYIADFYYYDKRRCEYVAEDVKGFCPAEYLVKKKVFLEKYVATGKLSFFENGNKKIFYEKK